MDEQAERIKAMLKTFTSAEDVIKAERATREWLDKVCSKAFDMTLAEAEEVFAAQGRAELHAAQVAAAKDGNNSMLLLLGKSYLGQSEEQAVEVTVKEPTTFEVIQGGYADAPDRKSRAAH